MTASECLVCGQRDLRPYLDILLRCAGCEFVTARLDAPVEARKLYEGDYFTGQEYLDYRADEAFFKKNFGARLEAIRRQQPAGRLLELGAAYGFFLDLARRHYDVLGFEVNPEAARHAREAFGVDVRTDDFLSVPAEALGPPFDVVVMWDVIEHLERPDLFVQRIAEISRPGACLYITTGDIGSRVARWRGRRWRMIHPPSHLHYFDRRTLRLLLERYGWRVVDVRSIGVSRSVLQVLYSILVLRLRMPGLYRLAERVIPRTWGFRVNTGDIMQVTAERCAEVRVEN